MWDIWQEVKIEYHYFYEFKPFIKKCLTAIDKAIRNSTDIINSSGILKNRQEKKDNRNQLLFKSGKKKSLKDLDNLIIIYDEKENTNILDLRLKKFIFFSQARYDSINLINILIVPVLEIHLLQLVV